MAPVASHRNQRGRRGAVFVPISCRRGLEVPDALAGARVEQRERQLAKRSSPTRSGVEVGRGRTGRHVNDAPLCIDCHPRPIVRRAAVCPGVRGPGVIAEFARVRNGVERPAQFAGPDVVGADIARWRGQRFRIAPAHNQQIFEHDAGTGHQPRLLFRIAAQVFAQIDSPVPAEGRYGMAGLCVESVDETLHSGEDARVAALGPVHYCPVRPAAAGPESISRAISRWRRRGLSACAAR